MSKVIGVHGIANTFLTSPQLTSSWDQALRGGMEEARGAALEFDMEVVAYGALFRPHGTGNEPGPRGQADLFGEITSEPEKSWANELLYLWWIEAANLSHENRQGGGANELGEDPWIQPPDLDGRARIPTIAQAALLQLSKSRFFRPFSQAILISELGEVRKFLYDPTFKSAILKRFEQKITPDTRVVIGHSLGSIVAYEALCLHPEWSVDTFVTLGCPLGIPNVIFDALTPKPINGQGSWPNVRKWVNIADRGDLVALVKRLAPQFGVVQDVLVNNGWRSHDALRYLTAVETATAVVQGLTSSGS